MVVWALLVTTGSVSLRTFTHGLFEYSHAPDRLSCTTCTTISNHDWHTCRLSSVQHADAMRACVSVRRANEPSRTSIPPRKRCMRFARSTAQRRSNGALPLLPSLLLFDHVARADPLTCEGRIGSNQQGREARGRLRLADVQHVGLPMLCGQDAVRRAADARRAGVSRSLVLCGCRRREKARERALWAQYGPQRRKRRKRQSMKKVPTPPFPTGAPAFLALWRF